MDNKSKPKKANGSTKKAKSSNNSFVPMLSFVLALGACAATAVTFFNMQQLASATSNERRDINREVEQIQSQQKKSSILIQDTIRLVTDTQEGLSKQISTVEKSIDKALKEQNYKSDDWMLIKANHYLQLAQVNLHWTGDLNSTMVLLQAADKLLAKVNQANLFEVRQALAKEIASLKATDKIDSSGILSRIGAIKKEIDSLPLTVTKFTIEQKETSKKPEPKSRWRQAWDNTLETLKQMVIIRYHNKPVDPVLSPLQQRVINEGLTLTLQQAQWALIHENQKLYEFSLQQAINSIEQHYALKQTQTKAVLEQLQQLKKESIAIKRPDISTAQKMLQQVIDKSKEGA